MNNDLILKKVNEYKVNDLIIGEHLYSIINENKKCSLTDFNDEICKLCLKKYLVRLTKGVFYRPKIKDGEIIKINEKEIKKSLLVNKKGVLVGESFYYEAGLINTPSYHYKIYLNEKFKDVIKINNISLVSMNIKIDKVSKVLITYLDVLENFSKIHNINKKKFGLLTKEFIKYYNNIKMQDIIINSEINKSTIAFLIDILNYFKVKNTLSHFLSVTTKYKYPKVDENLFK